MFDLMPLTNREKNLFNYLDNLEKSFFQDAFAAPGQFQTDIVDKGDRYELRAELPGFGKEQIKLDLDQDRLTIRAQREESQEEKQENYIRQERRYGAYSRSFDVSGIDVDRIEARYENGVLNLHLPKRAEQPLPPARQIEIQ